MTALRTLAVWLAAACVAGLAPAAALGSVLDAQAAASYHWVQPPAWIETAPVVPANPADASYHWVQPPAWIPIEPAAPFIAPITFERIQLW